MNINQLTNIMSTTTGKVAVIATATVAASASTFALAGDTIKKQVEKQAVCEGTPAYVLIVASTSVSDLKLSQRMAPQVAPQAISRAVESCGTIAVASLGGTNATADLTIASKRLTPEQTKVYGDITPVRDDLRAEAVDFVDKTLLTPIKNEPPQPGSPYLNGLASIAHEFQEHGVARADLVLIGDGLADETGRHGQHILFSSASVDEQAVGEFEPLLKPLTGSCIILVGAGAGSHLDNEGLRQARDLLGKTLEDVGATFIATRTSQVPFEECDR